MSELQTLVAHVFSEGGQLVQAQPRFTPRQAQTDMALAVAQAIDERSVLVVEAGTGVGKTYAYLVPALLSGQRVLVSTASKSLQDQLFGRDLPRLCAALGLPLRTALLKGRSSYLCLHRMKQARQQHPAPDVWAQRALAKVERWALSTQQGDLAELDTLDERSPVLPWVTSTKDNCLGSECPDYGACHVVRARREAMAADVVVVNHHLFFADVGLRESGVAELLPQVGVAVFDEAHQLPEIGVQFLGRHLSTGALLELARDGMAWGQQQARGLAPWVELKAALETEVHALRLAVLGGLQDIRGAIKLRWAERASAGAAAHAFSVALAAVVGALEQWAQALSLVEGAHPEFPRLLERCQSQLALALAFTHPPDADVVRWMELSPGQCRLVETPLDIREAVDSQLRAAPKAWVFTSATLGDDQGLDWFTEAAGLQDPACLRVDSPFDYPAHARLYVPTGLPEQGAADHPLAVAELAAELAQALDGRCFVLTTTLKALKAISAHLRETLQAQGQTLRVLQQGDAPKRALLDAFLADPRSVLVGSHSFWEGIDVPGDALQCVLIDKLPFPPPNDPLVEARVGRLRQQGRDAFTEYFLAEAAVTLKQGAGRLIRSETDRGLLVVCDARLVNKGYGSRLRKALPVMPLLRDRPQALQWLSELRWAHSEDLGP
jgi:ATP-dependent DNA helicase DinG